VVAERKDEIVSEPLERQVAKQSTHGPAGPLNEENATVGQSTKLVALFFILDVSDDDRPDTDRLLQHGNIFDHLCLVGLLIEDDEDDWRAGIPLEVAIEVVAQIVQGNILAV